MLVQVDPSGKGEVPNRQRAWVVHFLGEGKAREAIVRHYITDLKPDEDVADFPETHELTWDEWVANHAEYGLDVSGNPTT